MDSHIPSYNNSITPAELKSFHTIDRELYTRLVINFGRNPVESMQVIALWMWLEEIGYPNIITKMLRLPDMVVRSTADEAVTCLKWLESETPPPPPSENDIPITLGLMNKDISFQFFHQNKHTVTNGIRKVMSNVCVKAFEDIVEQALVNEAHALIASEMGFRPIEEGPNMGQMMVSMGDIRPIGEQEERARQMMMVPMTVVHPLFRPRVPHPTYEGIIRVAPQPILVETPTVMIAQPSVDHTHGSGVQVQISVTEPGEGSSTLNPQASSWDPVEEVPPDGRTMFITFSKGYPMSQEEVVEYFTRSFGDCIESIHVQETPKNTQPLYARLVLRSATVIPLILEGKNKAKFVINGKHVWARQYFPKKSKSPPPPPSPVLIIK